MSATQVELSKVSEEIARKRVALGGLFAEAETATGTARERLAKTIKSANTDLEKLIGTSERLQGELTIERLVRDEIKAMQEQAGARRVTAEDGDDGWNTPGDDAPGTIRAIKSADRFAAYNGGTTSVSLDQYLRAALTGQWDRLPEDLFHGSGQKAMATDALGTLTLPSVLTNRIIDLSRASSRVIQAGALTARMNGPKETIARVTGAPSPAWKSENALIAAGDITFEPITLTARTLAARAVMSVELSDDVPTVGNALEAELTAAMAGELDRAALLGSGTPPEPRGLLNTTGVDTFDTSLGLPGSYADFSRAVQHIREAEGEPNAVIMGPDVLGELERLVDGDGNPLTPPESFRDLRKLTTTKLAGKAVVGDWSKFLVAIRQELRIEVSRDATDENGLGFTSYSVLIRATLRADFAVLRPSHFEALTDFETGS